MNPKRYFLQEQNWEPIVVGDWGLLVFSNILFKADLQWVKIFLDILIIVQLYQINCCVDFCWKIYKKVMLEIPFLSGLLKFFILWPWYSLKNLRKWESSLQWTTIDYWQKLGETWGFFSIMMQSQEHLKTG